MVEVLIDNRWAKITHPDGKINALVAGNVCALSYNGGYIFFDKFKWLFNEIEINGVIYATIEEAFEALKLLIRANGSNIINTYEMVIDYLLRVADGGGVGGNIDCLVSFLNSIII